MKIGLSRFYLLTFNNKQVALELFIFVEDLNFLIHTEIEVSETQGCTKKAILIGDPTLMKHPIQYGALWVLGDNSKN